MDKEHTIKNIQQLIYYNGADNNLAKTELFTGVDLYYLNFGSNPVHLRHEKIDSIIQINYCKAGQLRWNMKSGSRIYLNYGDYSLHSMQACTQSLMEFPQGFYKGLTICIDLAKLKTSPLKLFGEIFDVNQLCQKFCGERKAAALPASRHIEHIFSEVYDLPERMILPYLKLKCQELLLFLEMTEPAESQSLDPYHSGQTETIRRIHSQITENLSCRYTIEELSRQYLINTAALKNIFKSVYGLPIASYMKHYRIRKAAELLRESSMSISDAASAVGYESQSKFSAAFKDIMKMLPSDYRRQYK